MMSMVKSNRLLKTLSYDYFINDSLLQLVTQHPYLRVLLENTMLKTSLLKQNEC